MGLIKLVIRSLIFYRRTNYGTILGTAIGTAILIGALIVGDSVRFSLRQMVFARLGSSEYSLETGDRYFRTQLADELAESLQTNVAPLLMANGIVAAKGGQSKLNRVQIVGVDARFGRIGSAENIYKSIADDEIIVNKQLANRLDIQVGDEVLLRIEKLDFLPKDAPLALDSDVSHSIRVKVKAIVSGSEFGHFNLKSNQVVPSTAFVSLAMLGNEMGIDNHANILLIAERIGDSLILDTLRTAMNESWTLSDAGLNLVQLRDRNVIELNSRRIFLEPAIVEACYKIDPNSWPIFTYFVNKISSQTHTTPYSFISTATAPTMPEDINNNDIIVNNWLAKDLDVAVGDSLLLAYYIMGPMRQLIEKHSRFCIKKIVPISGVYADSELMPGFPGLADAENCRDWNPGIPINLDLIRLKDETYWDVYRGTPKGFITLEAAQTLWHNRFGNLTAIRFEDNKLDEIKIKLAAELGPSDLGFYFRPVLKDGLQASIESVDFAELFIGLSLFIVLSALLLTSMLFVLAIEQRSRESGLFLALGIPPKYVRRFILMQGALLALTGTVLGIIFSILYNQIILFALKTIWRDAVGTSALVMYIDSFTVITGAVVSIVLIMVTMWLVVRKQTSRSIVTLQSGSSRIEAASTKSKSQVSLIMGMICLVVVFIIVITTDPARGGGALFSFFFAGFILLLSGILFADVFMKRSANKSDTSELTVTAMGIRNNARRRMRSLTLIGLLASGLFIVFTVGANRHGAIIDAHSRSSGTGGFALFAETVIPILYDLNSDKGRQFYGTDVIDSATVKFVQFRVREGDDASCLNLNRVSNPQLLGVKPELLARRKAFTFSKLTEEVDGQNPWLALNQKYSDVVPAIADETVIIWGLGKTVGDTLEYRDEAGKKYKIKLIGGLANSIFQGNIIISESTFIEKYPSQSGYSLFLIDAPDQSINVDRLFQNLTWALQDFGIDIVTTAERLSEFNKVENTYLSIFLILGGLGLILGTIGIGIIVLRNVLERRGELAILRAVGYGRKSLYTLLLSEHYILLFWGILCGIVAALISVLPALMSPGVDIPYLTILILFITVALSGGFWVYISTAMAMRGDMLPALRDE